MQKDFQVMDIRSHIPKQTCDRKHDQVRSAHFCICRGGRSVSTDGRSVSQSGLTDAHFADEWQETSNKDVLGTEGSRFSSSNVIVTNRVKDRRTSQPVIDGRLFCWELTETRPPVSHVVGGLLSWPHWLYMCVRVLRFSKWSLQGLWLTEEVEPDEVTLIYNLCLSRRFYVCVLICI